MKKDSSQPGKATDARSSAASGVLFSVDGALLGRTDGRLFGSAGPRPAPDHSQTWPDAVGHSPGNAAGEARTEISEKEKDNGQ